MLKFHLNRSIVIDFVIGLQALSQSLRSQFELQLEESSVPWITRLVSKQTFVCVKFAFPTQKP